MESDLRKKYGDYCAEAEKSIGQINANVRISVFLTQVSIRHKLEDMREAEEYAKVQEALKSNRIKLNTLLIAENIPLEGFDNIFAKKQFFDIYNKLVLSMGLAVEDELNLNTEEESANDTADSFPLAKEIKF